MAQRVARTSAASTRPMRVSNMRMHTGSESLAGALKLAEAAAAPVAAKASEVAAAVPMDHNAMLLWGGGLALAIPVVAIAFAVAGKAARKSV
eukprot:CAMPEP_0113699926 /NCGR_PEP_ID=MMETSP0038_2-20120614/23633_1 /TAXON_ID=2898 /ORGANISM="Cryptomonas paramecium" /LENGTH=91 /DNA_ID=CAMNT_0000623447 /DNA_START=90 /DNA_END=365 /DNA_ORIENTATION=+ /assembly_acc=CAM_ASM_000170